MSTHFPPNRLQPNHAVPPGGVYANALAVWYTGHEFTLEFAVALPSEHDRRFAVSVARVKLPPETAWQLATTLSEQVARYEESHRKLTPTPPD